MLAEQRGKATLAGGKAATDNFRRALRLAASGKADAVFFTPFNKAAMRFAYPGDEGERRHTEALARRVARDIAEGAQPVVFNGMAGLMVNAPGMFHSQVGDLLAKKSGSFALMWSANEKGVKCGLRSRSDFNCIPLAESFGGGGHAQACGFKMDNTRLLDLLSAELKADPDASYPLVPAPLLEFDEDGKWIKPKK